MRTNISIEGQTLVVGAPAMPTDDQQDRPTYEQDQDFVDATTIAGQIAASLESLRVMGEKILAMSAIQVSLEHHKGELPLIASVTLEAAMMVATAGSDVTPESLIADPRNAKVSMEGVGKYLELLKSGIIRIYERICELLRQLYVIVSGSGASLKTQIEKQRMRLRENPKGGPKHVYIEIQGRYADSLQTNGIGVTTAVNLQNAMDDINKMLFVLSNGHAERITQVVTALEAAAKAGFKRDYPSALLEVQKAFEPLRSSPLTSVLPNRVGIDDRFDIANYVNYRSVPLLANRSVFYSAPTPGKGHWRHSYSFDYTTTKAYSEQTTLKTETLSRASAQNILTACSGIADKVADFEKDVGRRLDAALLRLKNTFSALSGEQVNADISDLLLSVGSSLHGIVSAPYKDFLPYSAAMSRAALHVVERSISDYD